MRSNTNLLASNLLFEFAVSQGATIISPVFNSGALQGATSFTRSFKLQLEIGESPSDLTKHRVPGETGRARALEAGRGPASAPHAPFNGARPLLA